MNSQNRLISIVYTIIMGILTILLCLVVADGEFGLNPPPARSHMGIVVYWVSIIVLPLLFYKCVPWRYTFLNLLLYFVLYFPVHELYSNNLTSMFLDTGGFIAFPVWWYAALVSVVFWGTQSIVYLITNVISYIIRKRKQHETHVSESN